MSSANTQDGEHDGAESSPTKAGFWRSLYENNKGACLIVMAEISGASMDAMARFLQQGENKFHAFQVQISTTRLFTAYTNAAQVIVFRMGITFILSSLYMWWTKVPGFPLGAPSIRGWLVVRALFGFFGLFCLYCESSLCSILPSSIPNLLFLVLVWCFLLY